MLPYGFMADIFSVNIPTKGWSGEVSQRPLTLEKWMLLKGKVYFMSFYEK